MIRIVVTGSECTGKTTLARALARVYDTVWVPEFARRFVARKGAPPVYDDVEAIAQGQMAVEDAHAAIVSPLLIQDTDLLSTVVYSRHYYDRCPPWIEEAARERAADLYLLAGIDVPWTADGVRDRGDRRDEIHELFRRALDDGGLSYLAIEGSHEARLTAATAAIDDLRG